MADNNLGWLDGSFKFDDTFLIFYPFFSSGSLLGYFSVTKGSFGSGSQLYLVGGNDMSVLVEEKWPEMICAG